MIYVFKRCIAGLLRQISRVLSCSGVGQVHWSHHVRPSNILMNSGMCEMALEELGGMCKNVTVYMHLRVGVPKMACLCPWCQITLFAKYTGTQYCSEEAKI